MKTTMFAILTALLMAPAASAGPVEDATAAADTPILIWLCTVFDPYGPIPDDCYIKIDIPGFASDPGGYITQAARQAVREHAQSCTMDPTQTYQACARATSDHTDLKADPSTDLIHQPEGGIVFDAPEEPGDSITIPIELCVTVGYGWFSASASVTVEITIERVN